MKKIIAGAAAIVLAGFVIFTDIEAQDNTETKAKTKTEQNVDKSGNNQTPANRPNFVDKDGDGVCDNYTSGKYGKGRGAGKGKGRGNRGQNRPNFVDEDGDGVCDNFADRQQRHLRQGKGFGAGQGQGKGYGRGRGNCRRGK